MLTTVHNSMCTVETALPVSVMCAVSRRGSKGVEVNVCFAVITLCWRHHLSMWLVCSAPPEYVVSMLKEVVRARHDVMYSIYS